MMDYHSLSVDDFREIGQAWREEDFDRFISSFSILYEQYSLNPTHYPEVYIESLVTRPFEGGIDLNSKLNHLLELAIYGDDTWEMEDLSLNLFCWMQIKADYEEAKQQKLEKEDWKKIIDVYMASIPTKKPFQTYVFEWAIEEIKTQFRMAEKAKAMRRILLRKIYLDVDDGDLSYLHSLVVKGGYFDYAGAEDEKKEMISQLVMAYVRHERDLDDLYELLNYHDHYYKSNAAILCYLGDRTDKVAHLNFCINQLRVFINRNFEGSEVKQIREKAVAFYEELAGYVNTSILDEVKKKNPDVMKENGSDSEEDPLRLMDPPVYQLELQGLIKRFEKLLDTYRMFEKLWGNEDDLLILEDHIRKLRKRKEISEDFKKSDVTKKLKQYEVKMLALKMAELREQYFTEGGSLENGGIIDEDELLRELGAQIDTLIKKEIEFGQQVKQTDKNAAFQAVELKLQQLFNHNGKRLWEKLSDDQQQQLVIGEYLFEHYQTLAEDGVMKNMEYSAPALPFGKALESMIFQLFIVDFHAYCEENQLEVPAYFKDRKDGKQFFMLGQIRELFDIKSAANQMYSYLTDTFRGKIVWPKDKEQDGDQKYPPVVCQIAEIAKKRNKVAHKEGVQEEHAAFIRNSVIGDSPSDLNETEAREIVAKEISVMISILGDLK